jgi:hypothetical protein
VRVACEYDPAYRGFIISPEELKERLSKMELKQDFSDFQTEIQEVFGPVGHAGIRGVIQLSDLLRIGTREGSLETEIDVGRRRIMTDPKLQERLLAALSSKSN